MWPFRKRRLAEIHTSLPREELLRRSRLLVLDDERPELIDDLKKARFAVDYEKDITKENLDIIDRSIYDLILLDFGNVGTAFGHDQGLSLLRHLKRVNPTVVVLAYTSKALPIEHADFYRLADGTLAKDAGIAESLEKIEEGLRKSQSLDNMWAGLLALSGVKVGSKTDLEWQDRLVRGTASQRKMRHLREDIEAVLGSETATKIGTAILAKLVESILTAHLGR